MQSRFACVIGNILGHYNTALIGLLAPFLAPLFFEKSDPLTGLILMYAIMPLGILTKPLGSLFFGWIGDRLGRRQALFYSLFGMGITTFSIGCLPIYSQAGIFAPLSLALAKMMLSFCAAGESTGASIFVMENTPLPQRNMMSSFYGISTMIGPIIASGLVTFFSLSGWVEHQWRILFFLGGATALFGLFLRRKTQEGTEFKPSRQPFAPLQHKKALLSIILASGFSYTTYSLAFTLMNGYVPLITTHSKTAVMEANTPLMILDMLLFPFLGYLAHRFGKEKLMLIGALGSSLFALPLFYLLEGASIPLMIAIRSIIVLFGVAFAAPYHAWKLEIVPPEHRYTILSFGCALGTQLIGAPSTAISLWLYQKTGAIYAPGLYLTVFGFLAFMVVFRNARERALIASAQS